MINPETGEALVQFPCDFMFKITGLHEEGFEDRIIGLLKQVDSDLKTHKIMRRFSKTNKYISLSVYVYVTQQSDINKIYDLLKSDASVLWGL